MTSFDKFDIFWLVLTSMTNFDNVWKSLDKFDLTWLAIQAISTKLQTNDNNDKSDPKKGALDWGAALKILFCKMMFLMWCWIVIKRKVCSSPIFVMKKVVYLVRKWRTSILNICNHFWHNFIDNQGYLRENKYTILVMNWN